MNEDEGGKRKFIDQFPKFQLYREFVNEICTRAQVVRNRNFPRIRFRQMFAFSSPNCLSRVLKRKSHHKNSSLIHCLRADEREREITCIYYITYPYLFARACVWPRARSPASVCVCTDYTHLIYGNMCRVRNND